MGLEYEIKKVPHPNTLTRRVALWPNELSQWPHAHTSYGASSTQCDRR